jgi:hypothetical protein
MLVPEHDQEEHFLSLASDFGNFVQMEVLRHYFVSHGGNGKETSDDKLESEIWSTFVETAADGGAAADEEAHSFTHNRDNHMSFPFEWGGKLTVLFKECSSRVVCHNQKQT